MERTPVIQEVNAYTLSIISSFWPYLGMGCHAHGHNERMVLVVAPTPGPTLSAGEAAQHAAHPATADWGTSMLGLVAGIFLILWMLLLLWAVRSRFGGRHP